MTRFLHKNRHATKKEGGYILLLTLLVISILLAVGFGIYDITQREVRLSSFLRDSGKALAAADRGAECALYWDRSTGPLLNGLPYTIFATGTNYTSPNLSNVNCDGINFSAGWTVTKTSATGTTVFNLPFADGTCVDVTVIKAGNESTTVIGDGYNTCNAALPRRTQREIAVSTNF